MSNYHIERGDIFYIDKFGYQSGSEQRSGRPGIVVSCNENNDNSRTVEIVYTTTKQKTELPTHVIVSSTPYVSTALCEQITTVDKERLGNYIGACSEEEMEQIDEAIMISLGLHRDEISSGGGYSEPEPIVAPDAASAPVQSEEFAALRAERDVFKSMYEALLNKVLMAVKSGVAT